MEVKKGGFVNTNIPVTTTLIYYYVKTGNTKVCGHYRKGHGKVLNRLGDSGKGRIRSTTSTGVLYSSLW